MSYRRVLNGGKDAPAPTKFLVDASEFFFCTTSLTRAAVLHRAWPSFWILWTWEALPEAPAVTAGVPARADQERRSPRRLSGSLSSSRERARLLTEPRSLLQVTSLRGPGRSGTASLCCFHPLGEGCGAGEPQGKGSALVVPAELA